MAAETGPNFPARETEPSGEVFIIFPVHLDSFIAFDLRPSLESFCKVRYFGMTDVFSNDQLERIRVSHQEKNLPEERDWQRLIKTEVLNKFNKARPEVRRGAKEVLIWCDFPLEDLLKTSAWNQVVANATLLGDQEAVKLMFEDLFLAEARYRRARHSL